MRNRADARVRYEANHACASGAYGHTLRLREKRIRSCEPPETQRGHCRSTPEARFPVLPPDTNVEFADRSILSSTKWGPETRSDAFVGKVVRPHSERGRARICHRHCSLDVKFSLAAMVEQAEGCLTALLDLGNDQPRADCVNRPGGDENDIAGDTACHTTRSQIEPSSTAWRNCCRVSRRLRPRATLAPGAALRTYQASVLPFGSPIDCAYASLGWTWMESGSLVNSSLSRSEGRLGRLTRALVPDFADRDAALGAACSRAPGRGHPRASAGPACAQVRSP